MKYCVDLSTALRHLLSIDTLQPSLPLLLSPPVSQHLQRRAHTIPEIMDHHSGHSGMDMDMPADACSMNVCAPSLSLAPPTTLCPSHQLTNAHIPDAIHVVHHQPLHHLPILANPRPAFPRPLPPRHRRPDGRLRSRARHKQAVRSRDE